MRLGFDDPTYEDLVGTPEEVAKDARWLSGFSTPRSRDSLKRLTATCLPGWHEVKVGKPFRYVDEYVRLDDTRNITAGDWKRARDKSRRFVLHCPRCGVDQPMWAKGWTWA